MDSLKAILVHPTPPLCTVCNKALSSVKGSWRGTWPKQNHRNPQSSLSWATPRHFLKGAPTWNLQGLVKEEKPRGHLKGENWPGAAFVLNHLYLLLSFPPPWRLQQQPCTMALLTEKMMKPYLIPWPCRTAWKGEPTPAVKMTLRNSSISPTSMHYWQASIQVTTALWPWGREMRQ